MTQQHGTFIRHRNECDNNTSFAVSQVIGKRTKPFTNSEFGKDCNWAVVVDIVCSEKRDLFANIILSVRNGTRRVEDLASDIKLLFQKRATNLSSLPLH